MRRMLIGLGLALITLPASAQDMSKFTEFDFSPTTGKVGYHMVANNGFANSPCADNDSIAANGIEVSGTIPPGLTAPSIEKHQFTFEGTPRQAGDWMVTVTFKTLHCYYGGGPDYGDRTTVVRFHIDP